MSTQRILLGIGLLAPLGLCAFAWPKSSSAPAVATTSAEAVEYDVDPTHSGVFFKVKHMGASWFYARFDKVAGKIQYDEADPSKSYVLLTIDATSVDTRTKKLDEHITSSDFLDAKQFPEIVFESESVKAGKQKDTLEVQGNLTLRGVSKPLTVTVEKVGSGDMRGRKVIGFHTRFTIDRTDFGVNYGADNGGVGKDVELTVSVEAYGK